MGERPGVPPEETGTDVNIANEGLETGNEEKSNVEGMRAQAKERWGNLQADPPKLEIAGQQVALTINERDQKAINALLGSDDCDEETLKVVGDALDTLENPQITDVERSWFERADNNDNLEDQNQAVENGFTVSMIRSNNEVYYGLMKEAQRLGINPLDFKPEGPVGGPYAKYRL